MFSSGTGNLRLWRVQCKMLQPSGGMSGCVSGHSAGKRCCVLIFWLSRRGRFGIDFVTLHTASEHIGSKYYI